MIVNAFNRLVFFFRPFRRGAYCHAPSIEELYLRRQRPTGRLSQVIQASRRLAHRLLPNMRQGSESRFRTGADTESQDYR